MEKPPSQKKNYEKDTILTDRRSFKFNEPSLREGKILPSNADKKYTNVLTSLKGWVLPMLWPTAMRVGLVPATRPLTSARPYGALKVSARRKCQSTVSLRKYWERYRISQGVERPEKRKKNAYQGEVLTKGGKFATLYLC